VRQPIRALTTLLFSFLLLIIFSCSKDNESENLNMPKQKNFIESALAKEIASEILFKAENNSTNSNPYIYTFNKNIEMISNIKP
jgi:hypothetical protein